MRTLGAVAATAAWLAVAAPAQAQKSQEELLREYERIKESAAALMRKLADSDKQYLENVIAQLRPVLPPNARSEAFLRSLRLDVPVYKMTGGVEFRPDAYAEVGNTGKRELVVNQEMGDSVGFVAASAARRMVSAFTGVEATGTNPVLDSVTFEMKNHGMAWIIAHELAHHIEGHTVPGRKPATLQESRDWELKADRTAARLLNQVGFSLYLVAWQLDTWKSVEEAGAKYGAGGTPESLSTHPSWATRYRQLDASMRSTKATPQPWIIYSLVGTIPGTGELTQTTLAFPGNKNSHIGWMIERISSSPDPTGVAGQSMLAAETDGEGMLLYMRSPKDSTRCRIDDRFAFLSAGSCEIEAPGGRKRIQFAAYRDSFQGTAGSDKTGRLGRVLGFDVRKSFRSALRSVSKSPVKIVRGDVAIEWQFQRSQRFFLNFLKGELTDAQFEPALRENHDAFRAELTSILGAADAGEFFRVLPSHLEADAKPLLPSKP
jgi:hypothetical protein